MKQSQGYSLIELMVITAIIAVLMMAAVPQFNKYQIKARLQEVFNVVEPYKNAITAFVLVHNTTPNTFMDIAMPGGNATVVNSAPNLPLPALLHSLELSSVATNAALIARVHLAAIGATVVDNIDVLEVHFVLQHTAGKAVWQCSVPAGYAVYKTYLPTICTIAA